MLWFDQDQEKENYTITCYAVRMRGAIYANTKGIDMKQIGNSTGIARDLKLKK